MLYRFAACYGYNEVCDQSDDDHDNRYREIDLRACWYLLATVTKNASLYSEQFQPVPLAGAGRDAPTRPSPQA